MKVYSKIYGDNSQDLIIIHGLFGMSDNWNSLGKRFSENFTVHLIDLRNHGKSPHSDEFNYQVMSDDVFEYMKDYDIQKPIILGHSLGGKVGMKIAFSNPEKILKLPYVRIRIFYVLGTLLIVNLILAYNWIPSSHFIYLMWAAFILFLISLYSHIKMISYEK